MLMQAAPSDIFDRICSWKSLVEAYHSARKGKREHAAVVAYGALLEEETIALQGRLQSGVWGPSAPRVFKVTDPKPRLITAPPFLDRVVHHALVKEIEPLFERRFIDQSHACRRGRGVHGAVHSLQKMIRIEQRNFGDVYVLKADISKFFASIDHGRLIEIVKRTVRCQRTLALLRSILCGYGFEGGIGLPVGALTSQLMANAYLDQLDHFVKDHLGLRWYLRYMDDWIIVGHDKAELWRIYDVLADMLATRLGLRLNRKSTVQPIAQGVDFCGYRVFATHILPRKRNIRRARKRLQQSADKVAAGADIEVELAPRLASFRGYVAHCSAGRSLATVILTLNETIDMEMIDVRKRQRRDARRAAKRSRKGRRCRPGAIRHLSYP